VTEDQAKTLSEGVKAAAGDGCPRCFALQSGQPTRIVELVTELNGGIAGAKNPAGFDTHEALEADKATKETP